MATKKTVAGRISGRRGNPKTNVKRLAKKARAEVAALLKRDRIGKGRGAPGRIGYSSGRYLAPKLGR